MSHEAVLVTGAGGFLGRHLCRVLVGRGFRVHGLARKRPKDPIAGVRYQVGSVLDPEALARAVKKARPAVVHHLAARLAGQPDLFETNVLGTLRLMLALAGFGVRRVVLASTCEVYGRAATPFREAQKAAPASDYARSKEAAERAIAWSGRQFGIPVTVLRFSLVYGPDQPPRMFIPALAAAARAGRPFPMTGGGQARDFVHVDDAVRAFLSAAASRRAEDQTINIGSGRSVTLREAARLAEKIAGRRFARLGALPYRKNEVWRYAVATGKARRLLEWRPRVTLEAGLRRLLQRQEKL